MNYTLYQLLWFFLLYSFIGWAVGTSVAAVREHLFIDVGFLFGPYCPAYGFSAVAFTVFLPELKNQLFLAVSSFHLLSHFQQALFWKKYFIGNGGTTHGKDSSLVVMSTSPTPLYGDSQP